MSAADARARFAAAPVARLATVADDGRPHLVPFVFAVQGDTIYSAVDHKPKSTRALRRLANIAANPSVCALADHYADDWTQLWWARADGDAHVADVADHPHALAALAARYPVYADTPPDGPLVIIDVARWSGWQA